MISTSSLKRVAHYAGAFLLAGAVVGCGDDGGGTPDAGTDGGVDAAPCEGHGCVGVTSPFQLDEGGEFRLERLQQNDDDTMNYLASQAFFFKGQEPGARDLGRADVVIELRPEIAAQGYGCQDSRVGNLFDNGYSPEAQAIVNTREYYDVGEAVTLTNTADENDVITLSKRTDEIDLSASLTHKIVYRGPDEQDVTRNTSYKPALVTGSAQYPVLDLKYGESIAAEEQADENGVGEPKLFMPSEFELTSPVEDDYFTPDALVFTKGEDLTITYTAEPAPADWPTILPFIAFVSSTGKVVAACVKAPTEENPTPDNGQFIVPHELLEVAAQEEPGGIILGRFTHVAWEYQQDKTRLDLLGIECKLAPPYKIEEAQGGGNN